MAGGRGRLTAALPRCAPPAVLPFWSQHDRPIESVSRQFRDPTAVARYADGPRRFVPALADVHRMTGLLLAGRAGHNATVLVVGAGGGLELHAMAVACPSWRFIGVDPAVPMLAEAARVLGPHAEGVQFVDGYIGDAPEGPFDAATCLLTLHFLEPDARRRTVEAIRRRLKPRGAVCGRTAGAHGGGTRTTRGRLHRRLAVLRGLLVGRVGRLRLRAPTPLGRAIQTLRTPTARVAQARCDTKRERASWHSSFRVGRHPLVKGVKANATWMARA